MLPITQLIEALTIPFGQIVPISHLPAWVMGVYNWRGEILWMIDLGHLVGFTPWHQQVVNTSTHRAIVLHDRSQSNAKDKSLAIGLVVSQVEGIEWCSPDQIYSPPASAVTPELAPFLRGILAQTQWRYAYYSRRQSSSSGDAQSLVFGQFCLRARGKDAIFSSIYCGKFG